MRITMALLWPCSEKDEQIDATLPDQRALKDALKCGEVPNSRWEMLNSIIIIITKILENQRIRFFLVTSSAGFLAR